MREKIILLLVFILAGTLRFYQLGKNPPSLNLDEVAIGYNAFAILKTGRDEYGTRFPLAFRSHDDYKPPLYIYLTVPAVAWFGLNEFAVRFPSALAGSVSVLMTFFLTKELFLLGVKKKRAETIALTSALLLAISPWHLQFSRAGFETNVAVFFTILGTWAWFKAIAGKGKWWLLTAISYALALYTYQTARLFIPLFSIALAIIFAKSIRAKIREAILALLLFFVLVAPLVPLMTSTAGRIRFKGTSVFENPGLIEEEQVRALVDVENQNLFAMKLYHNRRLAALLTVAEGYLKHFRPDFLFLGRTGPPVNYTPNVGLLYLIELPLILWGAHSLASLREKRLSAVVFTWILAAPVASAFTWDIPNSTRMTMILPTFQILGAVGLEKVIFSKTLRKSYKKGIRAAVAIGFLFSVGHYLHQYYVHAPIEFAESWQYGYKQAVQFVQERQDDYDKVLVSTNLRQPQNFFAFYTEYDPRTYIFIDGGTVSGGFLETRNKFGKFEFHPIDYENLQSEENLLLIDRFDEMPQAYKNKALKVIELPNGEPTIVISRT